MVSFQRIHVYFNVTIMTFHDMPVVLFLFPDEVFVSVFRLLTICGKLCGELNCLRQMCRSLIGYGVTTNVGLTTGANGTPVTQRVKGPFSSFLTDL